MIKKKCWCTINFQLNSHLLHSNVKGFRRIVYSVYQYSELLDSSNMCIRDWKQIAEDIWVNFRRFLLDCRLPVGYRWLSGVHYSLPTFVFERLVIYCVTRRFTLYFQQAYELYDGFVVLHGTDTLAYTASALSFMFENLGKTVIITGAQVPPIPGLAARWNVGNVRFRVLASSIWFEKWWQRQFR